MTPFISLGKALLLIGAVFMGMGILFLLGSKFPWLGRLPGDILIERKHIQFYFPLGTCLLLSLLLTLLLSLFGRR